MADFNPSLSASVGEFTSREAAKAENCSIASHGQTTEITHGVVIVATGAKQYQPKEYLYGQDDSVITQRDLEVRLASGNGFLAREGNRPAKTVVMIQCVGSRDADHPYCSRVCCAEAMKNALRIKALSPETHVYVLYRDIRTYGFKESYYTKARQQGVVFVRYDEDRKPRGVTKLRKTAGHRLRPDPGDAANDLRRPGGSVRGHSSA